MSTTPRSIRTQTEPVEVVELGTEQSLQAAEVVDEALDDGARQARDLAEDAQSARADRCVEGLSDDGEAERLAQLEG